MRTIVTGAAGQVGVEVVAELARRGEREVVGLSHADLEVTDRPAVDRAFADLAPDLVIHTAAFTAVDACESEVARAYGVNAFGTRNLAAAARRFGAHLVYLSTDYVFDGRSPRPYLEWDLPNPVSVYGRSKLGGERELGPEATIARTSWVCGATGQNMAKTVLRLARETDGPLRFVDDQRGSPTMARDLARCLVDLGLERHPGIFHVTNDGSTSWYGFARAVLELSGHDASRVEPIPTTELSPKRPAPRPANSVLENAALKLSGLELLPHWREGLARLVDELAPGSGRAR